MTWVPAGAVVEPLQHTQFFTVSFVDWNVLTVLKTLLKPIYDTSNPPTTQMVICVETSSRAKSHFGPSLANEIDKEDAFVAFITPYFDEILTKYGMGRKAIWLEERGLRSSICLSQPRIFLTVDLLHPGMCIAMNVPNDESNRLPVRFGVVDQDLWDCVIIFESKLEIVVPEASSHVSRSFFSGLSFLSCISLLLHCRLAFPCFSCKGILKLICLAFP
ncbi:hypothetical protein AC1031_020509 [Aphanomyces cochlioides]|nr:hypothetical protein AC1031_020509 [Aphanomyces cochlioides]